MDAKQWDKKARELRMQEDRLTRRESQLKKRDEFFRQGQQTNLEREKSLKHREQSLQDKEYELNSKGKDLKKEKGILQQERDQFEQGKRRRLLIMLPILILVAVGTGYLTYDYYVGNNNFYLQLDKATASIGKLSTLLNHAEDKATTLAKNLKTQIRVANERQSKIGALSNQVAQLNSEKDQNVASRKKMTAQNAVLANQITQLKVEYKKAMDQASQKQKTQLINLNAYKSQINDLSHALSQSQEQLALEAAAKSDQDQQLLKRNKELLQKQQEIELLSKDKKQLAVQLDDAQQRLTTLIQKNKLQRASTDQSKSNLAKAKIVLVQLQKQNVDLQLELKKLNRNITLLVKKNHILDRQLKQWQIKKQKAKAPKGVKPIATHPATSS